MFQLLLDRIRSKRIRVGIIGLGYVGLPLAREFLRSGFRVVGFDIDGSKVEKINAGKSYIKYIDSQFIQEYVASGKLSATTDFSGLGM